jgi:hypothetical protein
MRRLVRLGMWTMATSNSEKQAGNAIWGFGPRYEVRPCPPATIRMEAVRVGRRLVCPVPRAPGVNGHLERRPGKTSGPGSTLFGIAEKERRNVVSLTL